MRLLILGGKGMAGHMMVSYFKRRPVFEVVYTSRDRNDPEGHYLAIEDFRELGDLIAAVKPEIIINCIGILNQKAADNPFQAYRINSVMPHYIARIAERHGARLIHISTDCVFSGLKGNYTEADVPDGTSVYAGSKRLGEVHDDRHLTIRTSIIGPELKDDGIGLFLWFMKQSGEIKGYRNVWWNGVTTLELAKAAEALIQRQVTGLYQLGADRKISKYDLLNLIRKIYGKRDVVILPETETVLDRTIVGTRTDYRYPVPAYEDMLLELRDWG